MYNVREKTYPATKTKAVICLELLKTEKAVFYPEKIVVFRKKGDTQIQIADIELITYTKPTFLNYLFGFFTDLLVECPFPKTFQIKYRTEEGRIYSHTLKIEYEDVQKLPETYQRLIRYR